MSDYAGQFLSGFQFLAPGRIVFGWGRRSSLGELAAPLGRRALLIGSRVASGAQLGESLSGDLAAQGVQVERIATAGGEPTVADVDQLVAQLHELGAGEGDFVVAVGGGSAIDRGKAAAALVTQQPGASVLDYLEGVGRGLTIARPPLPFVAMPTTAGTGSEATKNAVISVANPACKKSLRADAMLARLVIVDPELTVSTPPEVTAHSGMDAITQLIESYVSCRATPMTRALALDGLRGTYDALFSAFTNPNDREARTRMAYAALVSGMTLANGGLGLAHGVAAALGSICGVPHGLACAMMLPLAMQFNLAARAADYARLGRVFTNSKPRGTLQQRARTAVDCVEGLLTVLGIPRRLWEVGVRPEQLDEIVAGSRGNSMDGNPERVSDHQLRHLLEVIL